MRPFELLEPRDITEACSLLAEHKEKAKIVAGGQSLLVLLKARLIAPRYLINIKGFSGLEHIQENSNGIRIGALVTHRAIETSPLIRERLLMLAEMEGRVASVQIRNWGTIGGNLCHADPAGDPAPALIALGAKVKVRSVRGEREIPMEEFFVDYLESALEADEILTEIQLPYPLPGTGGAFIKEAVRFGDMAIASVAAVVTLERGVVKDARLVLGAVGSTPIRAKEAEKAIIGNMVADVLEDACRTAAGEAKPVADIYGSVEYKRHLVKVITKSVLTEAARRAQEEAT